MALGNNSDSPQSYSSDQDTDELERMRLWVDNTDWNVFGQGPDIEQDIQWAMQLLLDGKIAKSHRYARFEKSEDKDTSWSDIRSANDIAEKSPDTSSSSLLNDSGEVRYSTGTSQSELHPTSTHRFLDPQFLGAGAFGVVFGVHDETLGVRVSIKVLRPSRSNSLQLRQRFLAEAQATARLSHPGIVRIYETGQLGPVPYISTAYIDGGSLAEFLARTKPIARQCAWLLLKIADAVHHAHSHAVLHRDLKPSNILLSKSLPDATMHLGFEPILTDFGLAKRIDAKSPSPNLTSDGRMLGTLRYASPEQARGAIDEIDMTSDVFSLGIILYEMLVGKLPFDGPNENNVSQLIKDRAPLRPCAANPNIPRKLEAITLKCLAKEKIERYQTAHELWLDLRRYLNGQPVEAQPSTLFSRIRYAARIHPVVACISTITILANLAALVGLYTAWTREHAAVRIEQAAREEEQFAKKQERIAKESERESKVRERDVFVGIVSIFSELGDLIHAGTPIEDEQWLTLLEKSSRLLTSHCQDNPDDEAMLHRLSVLKHYLAVTYQTLGRFEESWQERFAVESILEKLVESKPSQEIYRYQRFFSKMLIGERLVFDANLRAMCPDRNGLTELDNALVLIRQLTVDYPDNVDHQDALASTKFKISIALAETDSERSDSLLDQVIETSTQIWEANPSRHLLIKYAINGSALKARIYARRGQPQQARDAYKMAVDFFEAAWRPHIGERWVITEAADLYEAWAEILIANREYPAALDALVQCDKIRDQTEQTFPIVTGSISRRMIDDIKRYRIFTATQDDTKCREVEERMRSRIETSKEDSNVINTFRQLDRDMGLPNSVSLLLEAIPFH